MLRRKKMKLHRLGYVALAATGEIKITSQGGFIFIDFRRNDALLNFRFSTTSSEFSRMVTPESLDRLLKELRQETQTKELEVDFVFSNDSLFLSFREELLELNSRGLTTEDLLVSSRINIPEDCWSFHLEGIVWTDIVSTSRMTHEMGQDRYAYFQFTDEPVGNTRVRSLQVKSICYWGIAQTRTREDRFCQNVSPCRFEVEKEEILCFQKYSIPEEVWISKNEESVFFSGGCLTMQVPIRNATYPLKGTRLPIPRGVSLTVSKKEIQRAVAICKGEASSDDLTGDFINISWNRGGKTLIVGGKKDSHQVTVAEDSVRNDSNSEFTMPAQPLQGALEAIKANNLTITLPEEGRYQCVKIQGVRTGISVHLLPVYIKFPASADYADLVKQEKLLGKGGGSLLLREYVSWETLEKEEQLKMLQGVSHSEEISSLSDEEFSKEMLLATREIKKKARTKIDKLDFPFEA